MQRELTVRGSLRAATAEAHERVDRVFSAFDLTRGEGYARFLQAQAAALLPLERALEAGAAPGLGLGWPARRREAALLADLAALGAAVPANDDLPPIARPAAALGTLYVLEGSRLGGTLIRRALRPGLPAAFLAPGPAHAWRELVEALERRLTTEEARGEAIAAADEAFSRFERCALSYALGNA